MAYRVRLALGLSAGRIEQENQSFSEMTNKNCKIFFLDTVLCYGLYMPDGVFQLRGDWMHGIPVLRNECQGDVAD